MDLILSHLLIYYHKEGVSRAEFIKKFQEKVKAQIEK